MSVTLYTNHCPCCKHLEKCLQQAGIPFDHVDDTDLMLRKGFTSVPMLESDGQIMNYAAALKWLQERTITHASNQV